MQRIESSTTAAENDMRAIKDFMASLQVAKAPGENPPGEITSKNSHGKSLDLSVSALDDKPFKWSLSAAFIKSAEVTQPWSTIGVDQWIESGKWWLLRSQMELYTVSESQIPLAAYINLIKASWILIDIIACHPQVPFITASTHSEVQLLSAELKNEFSRLVTLDSIVPDLSELEGQDLRIWETQARGPLLRPHKNSLNEWAVDGDEQVLFQRFAICELQAFTESLPCIVLFLVHRDGISARLVAQNQNSSIIMTVTFQKATKTEELGSSVTVNNEKIIFTTIQDAQFLCCLIETANFYFYDRRATHSNLKEFKAYVLLTAVKNQREDTVTLLLQRTSVNDDTLDGNSEGGPATVASQLASQQIAYQLNEQILPDSNPQRSTISLFSWAVQCGLALLVRVLLIEQPKFDGNDWHGMTPLELASFCGHESVVRLLIDNEANFRATDNWGCLPFHACFKGRERVARLLSGSGAEIAVHNAHAEVVRLLIDKGANIEAKNIAGDTALWEATSLQYEAGIALLLEKGADVNQKSKEGMSSIHCALWSKMSDSTVRAVLVHQLNRKDDTQRSPDEAEIRKETIILDLNSDWGIFFVDSPRAFIECPENLPSKFTCAYNKCVVIRPPGTSTQSFNLKFEIAIIHNEKTLDFSVGLGNGGSFKIKVVNGGERVGRSTNHPHGRNFQSFTSVELDKAATPDSQNRKVYRQVRDQLYKDFSWE